MYLCQPVSIRFRLVLGPFPMSVKCVIGGDHFFFILYTEPDFLPHQRKPCTVVYLGMLFAIKNCSIAARLGSFSNAVRSACMSRNRCSVELNRLSRTLHSSCVPATSGKKSEILVIVSADGLLTNSLHSRLMHISCASSIPIEWPGLPRRLTVKPPFSRFARTSPGLPATG